MTRHVRDQTSLDVLSVLETPAGRRALLWVLRQIRPHVISGPDAASLAALHDCAVRLEESFFSASPDGWATALREEIAERVDRRLELEAKDNDDQPYDSDDR